MYVMYVVCNVCNVRTVLFSFEKREKYALKLLQGSYGGADLSRMMNGEGTKLHKVAVVAVPNLSLYLQWTKMLVLVNNSLYKIGTSI